MNRPELPEIRLVDGVPVVESWSPSLLADLLVTYEVEMISAGFDARQYLGPGLSEEAVRSQLAALQMTPTSELISWFAWANGASVPLPGIHPASLEKAIEMYVLVHLPMYEEPEPGLEDITWGVGKGWLRLELDNYSKAVDCNPGPRNPPEVHQTTPEFGQFNDTWGRCRSLCTLVTWWIEGLRGGAYEWNASLRTWFVGDFSAIPELQKRYGLA
ncbi:hypothetical protein AS850_14555 [Frondihabitans sp. 762G35]|uniref:hypothetical protein n=1 Tax=Frondihabitans sp. 762G35 TaxID=1446794 RepID=UPI000D22A81A|nr:hypothetical protein [Frondihabitans sp. 762G35]ARC58303.1 hypothetical protein AS850_14555 [Frondihabitans sp. 762G35]